MSRIRLLTYNIHKGIGGRDRRYDLNRIIDVLQMIQPDMICLQEVDTHVRRSDMQDQPAVLAQKLGFHSLFQLNVPVGRSGGYGNLILTRWPMELSRQFSLRDGDRKPRGLQIAKVLTDFGPMALANWHLGLTHGEQIRQASRFLRLIDDVIWHNLPMLVAGDTNDWGNRLLRKTLAYGGFRQASLPVIRCRSFPAWFPIASLDKIFIRQGIHQTLSYVVRNRLTIQASDHLPLVMEFEIDHKAIR